MNAQHPSPDVRDNFQTCVDGATAAGLAFLLIGGHAVNARGYGPILLPEPSYELTQAHARFLLRPGPIHSQQPNSEPFVLD